jgi:hypothetical protein
MFSTSWSIRVWERSQLWVSEELRTTVFPSWHSCSLVRREWFSHGGCRFDRFDRMDYSFDRYCRMNVANPTFEEMARHWFDNFGTNPRVESFARSRSWFCVAGGRPGDIIGGSPASFPGGDMEVHQFQGWWTRISDLWRNDKGIWICDLQVCDLGQATWFVLLLALSCVLRVSFVCSLVLVHVFRGSLWVCASLLSFAGGVEPFLPPLRSRWFMSVVWELLCSICIAFLCALLAFGMAYVTWCIGILVS